MQHRVLMLGPALSVKGGITTVEQFYLEAWDSALGYDLRHIGTFVDGSKFLKFLTFIKALAEFCYQLLVWKPNILHIHFSWKASFYRKSFFVILAKLFQIKIILHCHASRFHVFYEEANKPTRNFIHWVLNSSDRILVVSRQWLNYFSKLPIETPVQILYNPVVCPTKIQDSVRGVPIILSLGRLGERKGTYDILAAIPLVLKKFPNAEFWLGGDGEIDKVQSILSDKSWIDRVRILGWVSAQEKERVLQEATIFLLPSYNEGLPLAILEAMAYGLPVISTPVGGIPEAVLDNETGFLVQPGNSGDIAEKIELLLSNSELCQKVGFNARRYVMEKFEVNVILQQLVSIYESLFY